MWERRLSDGDAFLKDAVHCALTIKVIKRMAYGFRDDAYFFLKIRAAFPGVG